MKVFGPDEIAPAVEAVKAGELVLSIRRDPRTGRRYGCLMHRSRTRLIVEARYTLGLPARCVNAQRHRRVAWAIEVRGTWLTRIEGTIEAQQPGSPEPTKPQPPRLGPSRLSSSSTISAS